MRLAPAFSIYIVENIRDCPPPFLDHMHLALPSGFHIEEDVVSTRACDELIRRLESSAVRRGGIRNLMSCDMVNKFARDPRLVHLARCLSGSEMIPYKATLFNKTSKANWLVAWHQDTALPIEEFTPSSGWSAPSIKAGRLFAQAPSSALSKILALRVHLDASTSTNGPLRVIPGSHVSGVLGDEEVKQFLRGVEPIECVVGRGGVIAMSPLILHASSKILSDAPRRVLHIEYAESLEIAPGIRLALS